MANAIYWKYGCHFHEEETGSEVNIKTDGNKLVFCAWRGDGERVLRKLINILETLPVGTPPKIIFDNLGVRQQVMSHPESMLVIDKKIHIPLLFTSEVELLDYEWDLLIYYYVGCAYNDGQPSLTQVSKILIGKANNGEIPQKAGRIPSKLSEMLSKLHEDIFSHIIVPKGDKLLDSPKKGWAGTDSKLSPYGQRAWEETKLYLEFVNRSTSWIPSQVIRNNNRTKKKN
ncbi:hypothetical protein [Fimbriiglobus ruber]|uniref:hypothetical protein n=1 Tax=Fimbriiglobus ruber TaxID=1908690 RepID=UPI00117BB5DB|nr:hypothetical protein [Fimbriiglobus ruber]